MEQFPARDGNRTECGVRPITEMAQGDAFARFEVSSVYVGPAHRFVVSLIVGVKDAHDAKSAAAAVLGLTKYARRGDTVWSIHDRHTGETLEMRQSEFEDPDATYVEDE